MKRVYGPFAGLVCAACACTIAQASQYTIGSPTDEEQAFVELINRARADASAEAFRLANSTDPQVLSAIAFFGVNVFEMMDQFAQLEQVLPPLSVNPILTTLARLHTGDMFANVFQDHISSDDPPAPFSPGDDLAARAAEFPGYNYQYLAENIFAYGLSVAYSHASFEIDWSLSGAFGMRTPPDHRWTLHDRAEIKDTVDPADHEVRPYREIGIGVLLGTNRFEDASVGPLVVTQVLGSQQSTVPFITGVAYYDLNGNSLYDAGEGLSGITVETAEGDAWAVTAGSGGYSIPVTSDGDYTVTFHGLGITPQTTTVTVAAGRNVKQDLVIAYPAPVLAGPATPVINTGSAYTISAVPGATAYQVRVYRPDLSAWSEGAENGVSHVTLTASSEYPVIQSANLISGSYTFHLDHFLPASADEIIRIGRLILPTGSSEIRFMSRLAIASVYQSANVEISTDDGATWKTVYSQKGTNGYGEPVPVARSVAIGAYAGQPVQVRFRYSIYDGYILSGDGSLRGWLIDDIVVTDSAQLTLAGEPVTATPSYTFHPVEAGTYHLFARAVNNTRNLPFGQIKTVVAGTATALELWRQAHFPPADLADPAKEATVWGNDADPERDGLENLLEFALGGDPNLPDAAGVAPALSRSGDVLKFNYTKRRDDILYRVLTQDALAPAGWSDAGVVQTPDPDISPEGTPIEATVEIGGDKRFLKLQATLP